VIDTNMPNFTKTDGRELALGMVDSKQIDRPDEVADGIALFGCAKTMTGEL